MGCAGYFGEAQDGSWYVSLPLLLMISLTCGDRIKVRRAMESSLQKAAMKIVAVVNRDKDHIPPIVTSEQNPFPYKILVNPKQQQSLDKGFGSWT